jgi:hypothetical protein
MLADSMLRGADHPRRGQGGARPARERRISLRWIVGARADLAFLMGGTAVGYALVFAGARLHLDWVLVWFAWMVLVDGPHVFATYTRTYLAVDEWRARSVLLWSSLGLFLLGPTLLLTAFALSRAGSPWHRAPLLAYFVGASLWGYWHVVRQHHGVMRLYQRRNRDDAPIDYWIDLSVIHVALIAAFVLFLTQHPEVRDNLGLPSEALTAPTSPGSVLVLLVRKASVLAAAAAIAIFLGRQGFRWWKGRTLNGAKLVFLAATVPYYLFICTSQTVLAAPLVAIAPLLVIPHDLQYHAMVWFYNRNRARRARERGNRLDVGLRLGTSLSAYAACALALGGLLGVLSCSVDSALAFSPPLSAAAPALFAGIGARELLFVAFQGVFLHHYFIDQYIWKPGREERVAEGLGLA